MNLSTYSWLLPTAPTSGFSSWWKSFSAYVKKKIRNFLQFTVFPSILEILHTSMLKVKDLNCNQEMINVDSFLINSASLPHLRREDFGVGQEVMAEHFDDEV